MQKVFLGSWGFVPQQFSRQQSGCPVEDDLVILAVNSQHRYSDLLWVHLQKRYNAVVVHLGATDHGLEPPVSNDSLGRLNTRSLMAVERPSGQVAIKSRMAGAQLCQRRTLTLIPNLPTPQ